MPAIIDQLFATHCRTLDVKGGGTTQTSDAIYDVPATNEVRKAKREGRRGSEK